MKKDELFGCIWLQAHFLARYYKTTTGHIDLRRIYGVIGLIDVNIKNKTFEAFKASYYRKRKDFKKIQLSVTMRERKVY